MSREDVEVVRKLYERWMRGEWYLGTDVFAPEFELELSAGWFPDPGVYRGPNAALEAWGRFLDAWDEFSPKEPEILDAGDDVVALLRIRGRGKASGLLLEAEVGNVITFRDGKIVRMNLCPRAEALEAAGLAD
jgi:ketosteroid isomerase-like protein